VKLLGIEDIVDRDTYAGLRPSYRAAVIDYKRSRRLAVGENITLLFEDRETLHFQIQEMLWVEGIALPEKIQHEIDTYNELLGGPGELGCTLLIEIDDRAEVSNSSNRSRSGSTSASKPSRRSLRTRSAARAASPGAGHSIR